MPPAKILEPWRVPAEEVAEVVGSHGAQGLTNAEAARRLAADGRNQLDRPPGKTILQRVWEQLKNPMILVLIAAAVVSVAVAAFNHGEIHEYIEAGIILAVVVLNCVLGVYQESKADSAIEALQKMSESEARVRRDGVVTRVPSAELVVGDL
ncbi:MAG: cation-transporting P-type ATPase, partial [Promicromonosporaceae bacterium]|nr:cation-transporting P-type ATPase [Promicromonosporaceae bacterium]